MIARAHSEEEWLTLPDGSFSARGHGGHVILVAPALDLVVVHRVDSEKKDAPRVEYAQFGSLMKIILEAMPAGGRMAIPHGMKK